MNPQYPIPRRQVELSRLRLRAQFHAVVLKAIIECGVDESFIAARIDKPVEVVKRWLDSTENWTLDIISDLMISVAVDLDEFQCHPIRYRNLQEELERAKAIFAERQS